MANWATLKAAINNVIKTNNNQAITGQVLQSVLNNVVSSIGENYQFVDIAISTTNPGTPDGNVFYMAYTSGTYANFGGITVNSNEVVLLLWKGSWVKKTIGLATAEELNALNEELNVLNEELNALNEELNASLTKAKTNIFYATCGTAANVVAKTVAMANFELSINARFVIKMTNSNTATNPTLNVNNTGAKALYYNGVVASADNTWENGETLDVYYDGTNYQTSNVLGGSVGNMILEWDTNVATTRLQVKAGQRKAGMIVSYNNPDEGWVNEQYAGVELTDEEWTDNSKWLRFATVEQQTVITIDSFISMFYISQEGKRVETNKPSDKMLNFYPVRKDVPIVFYTVSSYDKPVLAFYTEKSEDSFVEVVDSYNYSQNANDISFMKVEYTPKQNGYIRAYSYAESLSTTERDSYTMLLIGDKSKGADLIQSYVDGFTEFEMEGYASGYNSFWMLLQQYINRSGISGHRVLNKLIRVGKGFNITVYSYGETWRNLCTLVFLSEKNGLRPIYSVKATGKDVDVVNYTAEEDGYILVGYSGEGEYINKGEHLGKKLPYIHVTKPSSQEDGDKTDINVELSQVDGVHDHSLPNLFDKSGIRTYDSDFANKVFEKIGRKTDSTGCYSNNIECKEGDWFTRSDFGTGIVVVLDDVGNILGDVANAAYQNTIQIIPSDTEKYDFSAARYAVFVIPLESVDIEKIVKAKYIPSGEGDYLTIPTLRVEQKNIPQDLDVFFKGKSGRYYSLVVDDSRETPVLSIVQQEGIPMSELPDDFPTFKTTGDFSEYYDSIVLCPTDGGVTPYLYELSPTGLVKRYIKTKLNCPRILKEGGTWYYYGVNGTFNSSSGKLNIYKANGETFELVKGNIGNSKGEVLEPHDCLVLSVNPLHYICQRYVPNTTTVVNGESKIVNALHVEEVYESKSVWEWHSEDYPELWTDSFESGNNGDYLHGNTICLDPDGNLCLNNRNANQILVIERTWNDGQHTGTIGSILWKIGGERTHTGWDVPTRIKTSEAQQWYGSHDAVVNANGVWTMYDNRKNGASCILEFGIDTVQKTLTNYKRYSWEQYRGVYQGSVDKCAENVYLVSWGSWRSSNTPGAGIYDFNTNKAIFEIRFDATGSSAYRVYGIKKGQS